MQPSEVPLPFSSLSSLSLLTPSSHPLPPTPTSQIAPLCKVLFLPTAEAPEGCGKPGGGSALCAAQHTERGGGGRETAESDKERRVPPRCARCRGAFGCSVASGRFQSVTAGSSSGTGRGGADPGRLRVTTGIVCGSSGTERGGADPGHGALSGDMCSSHGSPSSESRVAIVRVTGRDRLSHGSRSSESEPRIGSPGDP